VASRLQGVVVCSLLATGGVLAIVGEHLLPSADAKTKRRHGTGLLQIEIRDDAGTPIPARLTFHALGDTPRIFFTTIDIARQEVGAVAAFDRVFVLRGDAEIRVPEGTYEVWVSRGPEWDTERALISIVTGGVREVAVKLHHVVDTPGWISGDFHVHASPSLDSRVPLRDRVHQFVADGVDLIVATDHNIIADYAPVITELGVTDLLASATGDEITTTAWGHFGAFPLRANEGELGQGAIATGSNTPRQMFAEIRTKAPAALIDVHHPRLESGHIGYFHLAGLDEVTGKAKKPGFSFDFDAIEVLNGYQDPDRTSVNRVIGDWIAFLDSGKHVAATGNSDSHHMTFNLGGYPRNYVAVGEVPNAKIDPAVVAAAVKAGHSYFTTGPIVDATIDGKGLGEVVTATAGKVLLKLTVRAANWISTSTITILGPHGAVLATRTIPNSTKAIRFDETIPLDMATDGYAIVRVDGERPMAPNVGDLSSFPVYPLAVTNPIWIDADGDGKIKPSNPYKFVEQDP
jgi:hypothetical protein